MQTPIRIDSRFPHMGTTIFTVMSRLAVECGAINLSQGFPDFQAEPALFDAMDRHMRADGRFGEGGGGAEQGTDAEDGQRVRTAVHPETRCSRQKTSGPA